MMRNSTLMVASATLLASLAIAGAASAQTRIQPGQTARGQLAASDLRMADESAYDCFVVATNAGQTYTVTQRSTAFDTYLAVTPTNDCGVIPRTGESNDDGPNMGTDSQIVFQGTGQPWIIRANSLEGNQFGPYTVDVAVSGAAAPSRPVGKPPAAGSTPPPANNNSDGPADDSIFTYLAICMASDFVETAQGVRDTDARTADSMRIFEFLLAAGEEEGLSEQEITTIVTDYVNAWSSSPELLRSKPPGETRQECIDTINSI